MSERGVRLLEDPLNGENVAADNFVYWQGKKKPTHSEVESVIHNFFSGALTSCEWEDNSKRFMVCLPGVANSPFHGISENAKKRDNESHTPPFDKRWIEVIPAHECLDVLTRMQDEYTQVLARGLAAAFARYWGGRLED